MIFPAEAGFQVHQSGHARQSPTGTWMQNDEVPVRLCQECVNYADDQLAKHGHSDATDDVSAMMTHFGCRQTLPSMATPMHSETSFGWEYHNVPADYVHLLAGIATVVWTIAVVIGKSDRWIKKTSVNANAFEEQSGFATTIVGEGENSKDQGGLAKTTLQSMHVGEEGILAKCLQEMAIIDVIEHKQGWVYFRGNISQSSRKELWSIEGIQTFDGDIIIQYINNEDELDVDVEDGIHVFELGDWVTPDLGAYQGDARCIMAIHDWGYDVAFIPRYLSSGITDDSGQAPSLVIATHNEAHTLSATGQAGSKPLIEDGLQILELSPKTITIAGKIPAFTLQMFMDPCTHASSDRANSMQALVTQSLWKYPRPQEWIFSISDKVSVQAQLCIPGRVINNHHAGLNVYSSYTGKLFRVGDFVKILSEENRGSLGCVQCTDDVVAIDVLLLPENSREISVWHNAVALTNPPQIFIALAPDKITDKMYTGRTPWQGINVIVLPSNYLGVTTAHTYKGQVGTVLDVLLKQPGPSGIRVCVCLLGTYRATEGFSDAWLDYNEVVEEITGLPLWSATPPHAGPSKDFGTGSAWDPSAPDPIGSHWYRHPTLAQQELHVNMLGKNQPQKEILMLLMTIKAVELNVCDFHQWVIIQGPGLGKLIHGIRYVKGSKPTKWWVREVLIQSGEVDKFMVNISEVRFMLSWHSRLRRKTGAVAWVAEQFVFKLAPCLQFISVFTVLIILLKAPWHSTITQEDQQTTSGNILPGSNTEEAKGPPAEQEKSEHTKKEASTRRVLESFVAILPWLHDLMMELEADPFVNTACTCRDGFQTTRCKDCIDYRLSCSRCFINKHTNCWNHWVQVWDEQGFFLGHLGGECPVPRPAVQTIIVDVNGIHNTMLQYCGCQGFSGPDRVDQLMRSRLFPATTTQLKMAFSFKDVTKQIRCIFCVWNLMKAEHRAGVLHKFDKIIRHRRPRNLMVFCPACPEMGWNIEVRLANILRKMRHTNQLQLTGNGNFHINKQEKNTDPDDLALVGGRGIFPSKEDWEAYLQQAIKPKGGGKKVPCNNHKAVTSQNARFDNCEYMGVGQIQCSHVFVKATVDFQKGEDQKTMDNALAHALELTGLAQDGSDCIDICFSYDINCQYYVHISKHFNTAFLFPVKHHAIRSVKIIPLCHINGHKDQCNEEYNPTYLECLCYFHGEMAKQFWAFSNGLGPMIHQMNREHGHEIYFYQAMDWNYRKLMNIPNELYKDLIYARKQFHTHENYFHRLSASLPQEQVILWQQEARECPASKPKPTRGEKDPWQSPYRHRQQKMPTMNGAIDALLSNPMKIAKLGDAIKDKRMADFVSEGLQLERQQFRRHLQLLVIKEKNYPNETDKETIKCKHLSLQKSIKSWFELRLKYMGPATKGSPLVNAIAALDTIQSKSKSKGKGLKPKKQKARESETAPEDWPLGLPSAVSREELEECLGSKHMNGLIEYETSLREGAAFDVLHAVLLAVDQLRSMGYDKGKNVKGYKHNTKAQEKLRHVKLQQNSGMVDWNAHRAALMAMNTIDSMQLKGLPDISKEDTIRWSASLQNMAKGFSGRGTKRNRHDEDMYNETANARKKKTEKKAAKKRNNKGSGASPTKPMDDNEEEEVTDKPSWLDELYEHGNINTADLEAWIYEGNRVQWFHCEAEMLRWQEQHEFKQADFLHVIRSFTAEKKAWAQAYEMIASEEPLKIGYLAFAQEHIAMMNAQIERMTQCLKEAGYAHLLELPKDEPLATHLIRVRSGKAAMWVPMRVRSDVEVEQPV
ncbi:hypothetical protein IW262DRAFT_1299917 [Armillaria fumosa]|nr:hypothetical protein IW262DRAFT_1299917 [Armillaria fumosa]